MPASVSEIMVAIRVDDSELGKLDSAGQKIDSLGTKGESVGRSMQTVGLGMAAVGAAGGAMFLGAFNSATNFEQKMDFVGAALGGVGTDAGVTEAQFASLSAQAQELGSSTAFSAAEVAGVQEELAKTGVTAEELMAGATSAVLDLSAATGGDLTSSAQIAAGAMNTFGLAGEDMAMIADVTTGALNNSSMSLADFRAGMNYLGPTLAQTGGDFDDAAAAIAYFNAQGMKGADAGVSLNRMIDNLVRPKNKEAAKLFENLGISAFDAKGELKSVPDMLDNINDALGGLSEQEQLELVSKLFGAESADVVLRALSGAGEGIRAMNADITQAGIAGDQAAERMDNFRGDVETLGGAFSLAGDKITQAFIPMGRTVVQFATTVLDAFNSMPAPIQAAIGAILALGSALTAGLGGALLIAPKILEGVKAFQTLRTALMATEAATKIAGLGFRGLFAAMGPIGIALAVLSVAILAYQNNWLGFRDAVNQVADALGPKLQQAAQAVGNVLKNVGNALKPLGQAVVDAAGRFKDLLGAWKPLQGLADAAGRALGFLADRFGELDDVTKGIILVFGPFAPAVLAVVSAVRLLGDAFNAAAGPVGDFSARIQQGLQGLSDAVMGGLGNLSAWLQGTLGVAFEWVAEKAGALRAALEGMSVPEGLQRAFDWLQTNVGDKIKSVVDSLGDLKDRLASLEMPPQLQALGDWFGEHLGGKIQTSIDKLNDFAKSLGIVNTEIQKLSVNAQSGLQNMSDGAINFFNSVGMWGEGIDDLTEKVYDGEVAQYKWGSALQNSAASMQKQAEQTATIIDTTQELSEAQKNFIDAMSESLAPTKAFAEALSTWVPAGEDVLDMIDLLAGAGAIGQGLGATMSGFVDGLNDAAQELQGVLGTMSQIANLGAGLQSAQDVAQKLVGDPGVYAVVDDLLAAQLITLDQYKAAQEDEVRIVEANTAAQASLNVMRVAQVGALADASEKQATYLQSLSALPAAEQAHALAMMDSANQAKVAAAMSTAYAAALGDIPAEQATRIILDAAKADPVLAGLLMDFGLLKGELENPMSLEVVLPDASNLAILRFQSMFEDATVREANGIITVTQPDGTVLAYDQFNNLVDQSGTVIPATIDIAVKTTMPRAGIAGGYGTGASDLGTDTVKQYADQISTADPAPVTTAIETVVQAGAAAAKPTFDVSGSTIGTDAVQAVADAISSAPTDAITLAFETAVIGAVEAAQTDTTATTLGNTIVTNAAQGVTEKKAEFDTAVTTMTTDGINAGSKESATADIIGTALVAQAVNGVTNDDDNFVTAATGMVTTAVNDAKTKAADAIAVGQEFVAKGTSGISTDGTNFSTQAQTMVSDAVTNAKTTAATATEVGSEFVTQAVAGITSNTALFSDAARSMVDIATTAAADAGSGMLATGEAIGIALGQGLINGMAAMEGQVSSQAASIAAAAETGARTRLGTRSPSKVFYEIGVDTVQGFINAIYDRIGEVFKALGILGDGATDAFESSLGGAGEAGGKAFKDSIDAEASDLSGLEFGSIEWHRAFHDSIANGFGDSGTDGGKALKDGVDSEVGDPSDLKVGSQAWHDALREDILGNFDETGRRGGKKLKDGIDSATSDIDLDDVARQIAAIANIAGGDMYGVQELFNNLNDVMSQTDVRAAEAADAMKLMQMQLASIGGDNTPEEVAALAAEFGELSKEVADAGGKVDDELMARINELSAKVPDALKDAGVAFGDFGDLAGDDIAKAMGVILQQIRDIMRELVNVMREAFGLAATEGTDAFAEACYPGLKDAMAGGEQVIQEGIKDWDSALITGGVWAGQTIGEAMANGMTQKEADWLNTMGMVVDRVVKKAVGDGKRGGTIGEEVVKQAGEGVKRREVDYQRRMTEMMGKGADAAMAVTPEYADVGSAVVQETSDGMEAEKPDLLKQAEATVNAVVKVFGDKVQALYDIGKNFMIGFARGMEAGADEVEQAAYDIGKQAEKELRRATESQSPSRAAMRVGEDVGAGFAEGIGGAKSERAAAQAAKRLWRAAWKELKDNIKQAGFLGAEWAVDFWQGMLNSPDMTGPLAAWITDQMVEAAKTALDKIRAQIAGIAAQLDIARNMPDPESMFDEIPVPQRPDLPEQPNVARPEAVDTTQRDLLRDQLEATRELTDAIEDAFKKAFSEAHKAHIKFVQGTATENEYLSKLQAAQNASDAKKANAEKIKSLEAQIKAVEKAMDIEEKRREAAYQAQVAAAKAAYDAQVAAIEKAYADQMKAYDEAVKARQALVDAETARQKEVIAALEQAQRDAQMQMTQEVIAEANKRISQYERELKKATDPQIRAELKAKIALEKERITVATELAAAIDRANNATNAFDLSKANAQIEFFTNQLLALEEVDVGGMLQGIADSITAAAEAMSQAADKIKKAFHGGGGGGGKDKERDKGTQDASDPSLGMSGGGIGKDLDDITKKAGAAGASGRKMGTDFEAGASVADKAIREKLGMGIDEFVKKAGDGGTKAGKSLMGNAEVSVKAGEVSFTKQVDTSVEAATVNGVKIGADRGRHIGVSIMTNAETGAKERTREVTKTVDGVVTEATNKGIKTAEQQGTKTGQQWSKFTEQNVTQGQGQIANAAKGAMDKAGNEAVNSARSAGSKAGKELTDQTAKGIKQGERDVMREGKNIMDRAGEEAGRDAKKLGTKAGNDLGQGVADGIRQKVRDAEQAARELAQAADRASRDASKSKSPSRVWMKHGNDMGDGMILGMLQRIEGVKRAGEDLAYTPETPRATSSGVAHNNNNANGGGTTNTRTIVFNGDVNLPNVHDAEDFIAWAENKIRTQGVSSGR